MKSKSTARRHHYLPQSYLALFTDTEKKDGKFFVLKVSSGGAFQTSPINVAVERDFNRVDINGHPPDVIENALSSFEQNAVQAIADTLKQREFPNDDDFNSILNLLCLIAVRNPHHRKSFNRSREQVVQLISNMIVSNKHTYEHHVNKLNEGNEDVDASISYEDMKRFIKKRDYKIEFSAESNLRIELNAFDNILPILGKRMWSLILAPEDGPQFICSDYPVTLVWKSGQYAPVGLGLPKTEVFFPLSPRAGFYGTFEDPLRDVVHARPGNVATMNRRVLLNAERHVFSQMESFAVWSKGQIRKVSCNYNKGSDHTR